MNCQETIVLDFETTGLSGDYDRVIEVGAVQVQNGMVKKEFTQLMNPGDFLSPQITAITGITDEMLHGMPTPETVMPELFDFIGDRVVIAHNAGFDQKFLVNEMARAGIDFVNPCLCTVRLARRLMPGHHSYSLTNLKRALNIYVEQSHRALDDARATAEIWIRIYNGLVDQIGNPQLSVELLNKLMTSPKAKAAKIIKDEAALFAE